MSSDESSDEIDTVSTKKTIQILPKKQVKIKTPSDLKKMTTKYMIHQALQELNTKKGVSVHAIKKFLRERYDVNTEKNSHIIKKQLKSGLEDGTIAQTKGIGASGSFKLILTNEKSKNKKDPKKIVTETKTSEEPKSTKAKIEKPVKPKKVATEKAAQGATKDTEKKTEATKPVNKKKDTKEKTNKVDKEEIKRVVKRKSIKLAKNMQHSAIKQIIKKRKSIGSKIKPPRMKPKA